MATGCGSASSTLGPQVVYSQKSTSVWLVHAMSAPESTVGVGGVRAALENRSSTGAVKTRAYYRTSNDGVTFEAWTALYADGVTEQTNDGTAYGADYVDLTNAVKGKQLIQWGVGVINTSGTATEMATTTLKVDRK
jgi:hypothetical protein